jgi:hypothetical protein
MTTGVNHPNLPRLHLLRGTEQHILLVHSTLNFFILTKEYRPQASPIHVAAIEGFQVKYGSNFAAYIEATTTRMVHVHLMKRKD